ncbi:GH92 family glycosyl hydrolase [Aequorivita todarodis]|uniref:GH92 family glycosyl hydrolase n=1 Tax=Aequorivita todarodis TaxID=2036821 RepID=UPI00235014A7|nr:GH92 family glycosyl hydrolase [Aequorivita todarodis]MDC8002113.1 GH92 family glycosyl hydrolase [Aequorivita todarodis]
MRISLSFLFILCSFFCFSQENPSKEKLINFVNPFIGTGGHGHTYPGATMPFGMMQLSPDTRLDGWDGCSGYHYSDEYIYGFSHTHLSGTGVSDYGDVLLMPTNAVNFNNGADGKRGYRAHFLHENETASPGYYKVFLDETNIEVELTVSERSGIHRYTFPKNSKQIVILDLEHRDKVLSSEIKILSKTEISGHRHSEAWAKDQRLFYNIQFSRPFKNSKQFPPLGGQGGVSPLGGQGGVSPLEGQGGNPQATKIAFEFDPSEGNELEIKIAISAVDEAGAKKNLEAEIGNKTFQQVKEEAETAWENQLRKIEIESPPAPQRENKFESQKNIFYTALYHTMIAPNLYQDVDGRYRGMDLEIHQSHDFENYTVFSLWDTYRAAHPLYTIIEKERTNDFINSLLAKYDEGGILPIWPLAANYTGCMIGYHAVPVIADAYLKGIRGYDAEKAFTAMKHSATQDKLGLKSYKEFGFISVEEESESVSKTLEYAYDDWTIAEMAKAMGKTEDYEIFSERAQYYKNVFDPETKFMRGRFRNTWFAPFDPYEVNFNYTEANSWQYSFYVPQDISGLINLMGGKAEFENQLDKLFTAKQETSGRHQVDITGLIGQYAHGNEPSHHMAYLYNFVNKPAKTQEKVHQILTELYQNAPDGISGNEDCGQMSAWYVFSALGFYPVTPASNQYIIGTPLFESATINLESREKSGGKTFKIEAENLSEANKYIASAKLNGKSLHRSFITHSEIMAGGKLVFKMTDKPSKWATKDDEIPKTEIIENLIVPAPFIAKGEVAFKNETEISLDVAPVKFIQSTVEGPSNRTEIYYSLNDSEFKKYTQPFTISEETILRSYSEELPQKPSARNLGKRSALLKTHFYKIDPDLSITLETEYANQYNGGGENALIDGIHGTNDFRTGTWQGYHDTDLKATLNLGSLKEVKTVSVNFLQDQRSWIFYPTEVICSVSENGTDFTDLPIQKIEVEKPSDETEIKTIEFEVDKNIQFIKISAKNFGALPKGHLGFGGKAWLFVDEISPLTPEGGK